MTPPDQRQLAVTLIIVSTLVAVFALDCFTPIGLADPVLYVVPILLTWFVSGSVSTFVVAGVAFGLTLLGTWLSPGEVDANIILNRVTVSFVLLAVAGLVVKQKELLRAAAAAHEALRESEARLQLALQSAQMGMWDWDLVTDTVRWSDQQFALFGIPREAFSGNITRVLDAIHPDERPLVEAGIARAKERNEEFRQEFRVVRSDGQTRWLAGIGRALTGASGRVARLIGVAYDITTRKEAEEALVALNATLEQRIAERTVQLTQANERWYWVARASNNGIWDWDLIYDTGYVSPRWKQLHGFAETAEPESFWEWATRIHPDDRDQVMAHLQAYLDRREPEFRREYRIQRRDGSYIWVLKRGIAMWDEQGRPTRMVGVETDITWRKEAEEALRRSEERLHDLTAALLTVQEEERARIADDLHDDFAQRLVVLDIELQGLRRRLSKSDAATAQKAEKLGRMVSELSADVQRLARGLHPTILRHAGLQAAVGEQVDEFAALTGLKTRLVVRLGSKSVPLEHATCLYRVLQESLQNVRKHANASSVVVRLLATRNGVGLCVHDDGQGMDKTRTERTRKGIGFTSMVERTRMLNGTWRVRVVPDDGTEIHAWVPLAKHDEPSAAGLEEHGGERRQRQRQ